MTLYYILFLLILDVNNTILILLITRFTERFFALFAKKLPERFNEAGGICPPPISKII